MSDPLEDLVFECLDRIETEGDQALDDLCARHPAEAARLRSRIQTLRGAGLLGGGASAEPFPERLGDFELIERLGGGGMGVVFRARQVSLGREVALKLVRPDQMWVAGTRERFRREVEVIARLQHPGIVPVYTVGEDRGIPFFAMELVTGASLDALLAHVRGRAPHTLQGQDVLAALPGSASSKLFEGAWWECMLRIVREAAEALEHAHRRGVLHRDMKPSNLMLTREGRVLLVDFGLAARAGNERMTRTGTTLGSLPYLPPEQIEGGTALSDAQSDVYSLGVTLFELLALDLPWTHEGTSALLKRISEARWPSLCALNRALPREVEVVVRAATERDRSRRYKTAADFARDLSNVLEHRPIEARPAGVWLRARRWIERRPAEAAAIGLGALLLLGVPTALWLVQRAANEEIRTAYEHVRVQRDRARESLGVAGRSIESLLTRLASEAMENVPRIEELRRDLLQDALALNAELAVLHPDEPDAARRVADARLRLARMNGLLGHADAALEDARAAQAAYEDELTRRPDEDGLWRALAETWRTEATALEQLGCPEDALAALADSERCARNAKPDHAAQAKSRSQAAYLSFGLGDAATGLAQQFAAVADGRALFTQGAAGGREVLGSCLSTLGIQLSGEGRGDEARAALEEAAELAEDGLAVDGFSVARRLDAIVARTNLGVCLARQRGFGDGIPHLRHALWILEGLVEDFPSTPEHVDRLNAVRASLAGMLNEMGGHGDESEALLRATVESEERLCKSRPGDAARRSTVAIAIMNLAGAVMKRDDVAAEALIRRSLAIHRELLELHPENPEEERLVGDGLAWLAFVHLRRANARDAVTVLSESCTFMPADASTQRAVAGRWSSFRANILEKHMGTDAEREELARTCAENGLRAVRAAIEAGWRDVRELQTSPKLAGLRGQPGWDEALARCSQLVGEKAP